MTDDDPPTMNEVLRGSRRRARSAPGARDASSKAMNAFLRRTPIEDPEPEEDPPPAA